MSTTTDDRAAWLAGLQPGDKVIIKQYGYKMHDICATISRMTRTQIIVNFRRFARHDGHEIGDIHVLAPWTQEAADDIALRDTQYRIFATCRYYVSEMRCKTLTASECARVLAVLRDVGLLQEEA